MFIRSIVVAAAFGAGALVSHVIAGQPTATPTTCRLFPQTVLDVGSEDIAAVLPPGYAALGVGPNGGVVACTRS